MLPLALNSRHAHTRAQHLQRGILQQVTHGAGRLAITIFQLGPDVSQLRFALDPGNTFVHAQALILFASVVGGNTDIEPKVKLNLFFFRRSLTLEFADRAIQHAGV